MGKWYRFGMQKKYKYPTFQLRMPPELKAFLEEEAEKHGRSLNAEIVLRLEQTAGISRAAKAAIEGPPVESARQTLLMGIQAAKELAETLEAGLDTIQKKTVNDKKTKSGGN